VRTSSLSKGSGAPDAMSPRYRLFRGLLRTLARIFLGFEVHGQENTPKSGPLVVAANHARFFDPVFVCMAVPRRLQWMAKKELFVFPFRKFFAFIGSFPVDRASGGRSALRMALKLLSEGWTLGIFPEGTRRNEGVSPEVKSGAIMLAVRGKAPVLPVYIDKIPGPAARIRGAKWHAYIGKPINIDNTTRGRESYREAADLILREIYTLPEDYSSVEREEEK